MYYTMVQHGKTVDISANMFHYASTEMSFNDLFSEGITKAFHYRNDGFLLTSFYRSTMTVTFH